MMPPHAPTRPVKVLVNGLHAISGGGITYLLNLLPRLCEDPDIEVHLCLGTNQQPLISGEFAGISIHLLSFHAGFWGRVFHEQLRVPVLARRIGADVVFSPANYGPLTAPRTVILLRNALNVAFVERRPAKLAYWAMVFAGTALSLVTCRRAIAVSRYAMRSASAGLLRLVGGRISIVPHGVGTIFSPDSADEPREDFLLAVSDIYVQKNMHNLLLAVARLKANRPEILLRIAGRPIDQAYFESLQRAVTREGLERNVAFLGHVAPKDLVALYRRCALFVFPSSVETFGNPLVEAMACGAPIACADAAAMPEVVGDAAMLFDPADPADMADKIARVIDDRKLADALGKRGLDRSRLYSWDRTARLTADVLIEAAGRSTAGRATPADAVI